MAAETNAVPVAPAGTVARVVRLMAVIAEADAPLSIAEIAARLGLPRPTAHRLVNLLREEGLVEADPTSHRYQPGGEYLRIGSLVAGRHSLSELAAPVMRELVRQSRETCLLGLYLPATHQMMFAAQEASQHALGYQVELMQPIPVAWGASGRAILAYLPDAEVDAVAARAESSPVSGDPLPTSAALRRRDHHGPRAGLRLHARAEDPGVAGDRGADHRCRRHRPRQPLPDDPRDPLRRVQARGARRPDHPAHRAALRAARVPGARRSAPPLRAASSAGPPRTTHPTTRASGARRLAVRRRLPSSGSVSGAVYDVRSGAFGRWPIDRLDAGRQIVQSPLSGHQFL